ncbi:MAG TPA: hypothetical protein VMA13_02125 [Candidatus Saccharimonadales bacterium]|nr:hypothetical protein [Candidatus Saccharimonadales bacterium]
MSATANNPEEQKFAIFAEAEGYNQPLIMHDLSFGRLMDEVVVPYQSDTPFFIDGAPLKKQNLRRLKILRLHKYFASDFHDLNWALKNGGEKIGRIYGDQYNVRLEAILRERGEDVTSQVVAAFDKEIKPSLKDYLPKREELIKGALTFFLNNLTSLAGLKLPP